MTGSGKARLGDSAAVQSDATLPSIADELLNTRNATLRPRHLVKEVGSCGLLCSTDLLVWDSIQHAVMFELDLDIVCTCQAFKHNGIHLWPVNSTSFSPLFSYIASAV